MGDWRSLFYSQPIPDQHVETLGDVRNAFAGLADALEAKLPDGRYKSTVKTLLEQAAAMATKAFTHGEQEPTLESSVSEGGIRA